MRTFLLHLLHDLQGSAGRWPVSYGLNRMAAVASSPRGRVARPMDSLTFGGLPSSGSAGVGAVNRSDLSVDVERRAGAGMGGDLVFDSVCKPLTEVVGPGQPARGRVGAYSRSHAFWYRRGDTRSAIRCIDTKSASLISDGRSRRPRNASASSVQ